MVGSSSWQKPLWYQVLSAGVQSWVLVPQDSVAPAGEAEQN